MPPTMNMVAKIDRRYINWIAWHKFQKDILDNARTTKVDDTLEMMEALLREVPPLHTKYMKADDDDDDDGKKREGRSDSDQGTETPTKKRKKWKKKETTEETR